MNASRVKLALFGLLVALLALLAPQVAVAASPDEELSRLLDQANAGLPAACARSGIDQLIRVLCAHRLRVGVRVNYPRFGRRVGKMRQGYDIDVARAIAAKLGVEVAFETVSAATRIPTLADDRVDVIIATMGHTVERDGQVRFIRPHYYQSETTVVGLKDLVITNWSDIVGRTVCVTIGNASNAELVARGARLMLFEEATTLPDRLDNQTCSLVAQDNTFFTSYFANSDFAARYDRKLNFAQLPWGMAVGETGADDLARALALISQIFHRDNIFIDAARRNHVATSFLKQQRTTFRRPECDTDTGSANLDCVLPPFDAELEPTAFAATVTAVESRLARTGLELALPMLKTQPAWALLQNGVVNSLILITGTLSATLVVALGFGAALGSRHRLLRWPVRGITVVLQSSPIVLTLVVVASVMHELFSYSSVIALVSAVVALGLTNGCNAGQAIGEAIWTLRAEEPAAIALDLYRRAMSRSATQIMAFLINAAKGTPIASFIGAAELLSALTDITSFSSGRVTTYSLLLVFYTSVVMVIVWLCRRFQVLLERRFVAA